MAGTKLSQLAALVNGSCRAEEDVLIERVAPASSAGRGDITFVNESRYLASASASNASAVIVREPDAEGLPMPALIHPNPYLAYALIAQHFNPRPRPPAGIADSAVVAPTAVVDPTASVGPLCSIGANAKIGANTVIHGQCSVAEGVAIGSNCTISARVVIERDCQLGRDVVIQAGAIIGSDGFGFAPSENGWEAIPQIGRVCIGDGVHIGANTCIDRGALEDTVIEDGVILDNLIQVAHNVRIGKHTAIAGKVGIAGSTIIGAHCTIGGMCKLTGHLSIPDGTHLAADTLVSGTIKKAGAYAGSIPYDKIESWRKNAVRFKQLDTMWKRLKRAETELDALRTALQDDND
ncbi:UDP-3-O-(3-hydroxymyristoyl) glucosamine N-acyltransferase [gamma proteobacterium HTCC5015]|nr:UDP-3-O-(3-hydroxymyristoyl) glucosamine N-acyltransferase [gamma proteobacterium HTCC5015]